MYIHFSLCKRSYGMKYNCSERWYEVFQQPVVSPTARTMADIHNKNLCSDIIRDFIKASAVTVHPQIISAVLLLMCASCFCVFSGVLLCCSWLLWTVYLCGRSTRYCGSHHRGKIFVIVIILFTITNIQFFCVLCYFLRKCLLCFANGLCLTSLPSSGQTSDCKKKSSWLQNGVSCSLIF